MVTRNFKCVPAAVLLGMLGGCATVNPGPDYERAREEVHAATGEEGLYRPDEHEQVAEQVDLLLQEGLTVQESVKVSLLNNRDLQALLFEVGVSRADAVQAGLLSNPSLNAVLRFPTGSGSKTTEGGLFMNFIEFWHIPARKRFAESELERTVLEIAHTATRVAAQTKRAYFRATAAAAALAVAEENRNTAREFLDLTLARQEAGAATEVDVNTARSEFLEQEVLVRQARFSVFESRRQLALALGLDVDPNSLELVEALQSTPDLALELEHLLSLSAAHRLDLRAATKSVAVAEHSLTLERRLSLRSVRAGVSVESRGDETELGPGVNLQLPIFDQNQAQIAKAEYRLQQSQRRLDALGVQVAQQVRNAYESYSLARDSAQLYRDRILPLRQSSLELARDSFAEGKTGFLSVLEAQSQLLAARREYVDRLEALSSSVPDLEAACGRPLVDLLTVEQ
jgi:cobalt-zinc-cadmium efflux system outer membrane protein